MNRFGRLLTELKGTIAERTWSACALILLWLQLKRLTTALDTLFTAWRNGELPAPPPAAQAPEPVPHTRPRAPSSPCAQPRIRTRAPAPRPQTRTPRAPRPHQPHFPPPRIARGKRFDLPLSRFSKTRLLTLRETCALNVTIKQRKHLTPGYSAFPNFLYVRPNRTSATGSTYVRLPHRQHQSD